MSLKTLIIAVGGAALALGVATSAPAQDPAAEGGAIFEGRCKFCHDSGAGGAPERAHLASLPKTKIVETLTSGVMSDMAADLTEAQIDAVATFLTSPTTTAPAHEHEMPAPETPAPTPATPPAEPAV